MFGALSRWVKVLLMVAAVVAILVTVGLVWWFQRDEGPSAVNLEAAVAQVDAVERSERSDSATSSAGLSSESEPGETGALDSDNGTSGSDSTAMPGPSDGADNRTGTTGPAGAAERAGLAGVWSVQADDSDTDLQDDPSVSFAGFRVDEVLAGGIGDFTAVGRTAGVAGWMELTDTMLVAATVEVDMASLRTDDRRRDGKVRQALNTSDFPSAVFTLTEPLEIGSGAAEGETFSGSATGDLTIRGITNLATFNLEARLVGDTIAVVGSSPVAFTDYGVSTPTAPIVVSAEDHGIMEFQLFFIR